VTAIARDLPVTVALAPPLFGEVDAAADSTRERIEVEVSELLHELGLDRRPTVEFEATEGQVPAHVIRLSVAGRQCRFPWTTIAEALAYVDGNSQVAVSADAVLERLQGAYRDSERSSELLASVCRAAISAQPAILVPPAEDAAIHALIDLGLSMSAGDDEASDEAALDNDDAVERRIAAAAAAVDSVDILVDPAYLRVLSAQDPDGELFPFMREGMFFELGLPLPRFHLLPDPSLRERAFAFRINAVRTFPRIGLPLDTILVNDTPERLPLWSVDGDPTLNPATNQPGALVAHEHKESLEAVGLTTWDAFGFLILSFATALRQTAHALMTRDVADGMLRQLGLAFPFLESAARSHSPPSVLAPVLRELLFNGVPIRNLRRIVELLLQYESIGASDNGRRGLLPFIRAGLADVIASKAARGTGTVVVYLLDPELEAAVADHGDGVVPTASDDFLAERLSAAVRAELFNLPATAQVPALLTQDELRGPLRALLCGEFPRMTVLGYGDLPSDYNIQPVARISWAVTEST
jgi:flagellar biosynthesis component FlhA